jgi:hemerythrin-like domain-containing protein
VSAKAAERIRHEHRNMAKVLRALREQAARLTVEDLTAERLDLIYRMLYYVRVFPNRQHHPKEENFLFPALLRRAPEMAGELDSLNQEHVAGDRALADLQNRFARLQDERSQAALVAFRDGVGAFVESEFAHMRHEEDTILPAAERALKDSDWAAIDRAFASNRDPLFDEEVEFGFEALRRSLASAAGPHGTR